MDLAEIRQIHKIFEGQIEELVRKGKKITLRSFDLNDSSKIKIDLALRIIADYLNCSGLAPVMYSCAKEFLFNGIKANVKRVLFDINRINIFIEEEYDKGMKIFKDNLSPDKIKNFLPLMKGHHLYTDLGVEYNEKSISLFITNNVLMTDFEVDRIKTKYSNLLNFNDIGHFFEDNVDETEGAGLGITMVVMMLSNLDHPGFMNIFKNESCTTVRIVFPLVENFKDDIRAFEKRSGMQKII